MASDSESSSFLHALGELLFTVFLVGFFVVIGTMVLGYVGMFIGGVVGIVVAESLSREESDDDSESRTVSCQDCGARNDATANYCQNCGTELDHPDPDTTARLKQSGSVFYCDRCGNAVTERVEDCPNCGRTFR
ncbi:zinc-ribbon domain-containing protein [Halobacteriaceae archaeon GCM10025711]